MEVSSRIEVAFAVVKVAWDVVDYCGASNNKIIVLVASALVIETQDSPEHSDGGVVTVAGRNQD